jgi:serine/threonine protein kinase
MTNEHAVLFRDALEGIKFLHDQGYIHRDIKPANIGVRAGRAVILDIGQAVELPPTAELRDAPGASGTMNYLAPEREMGSYGKPADVWALGCIGFSLTYGYHPFRFGLNPWRPGDEYEAKRERWFIFYNHAIERLTKDAEEPEVAAPAGRQNNYVRRK